jgi:anthranilate phosphoribosyltransferase
MSEQFRGLIKKVGSGTHTTQDLTREEAALAMGLMLRQVATPCQIGAFLIAQRIKRPTGDELAGMFDAYAEIGPSLAPIAADYPVMVMGIPYDGRSRTAPLGPLVALVLAGLGVPVLHHGGRCMATKYGVPLVELWASLGVDWTGVSLDRLQTCFAQTLLGLVYLPTHFPEAEIIAGYRDELGRRPSIATLELGWCPYGGAAIVIPGYVHPPTEGMLHGAFLLGGQRQFLLVKGLEGSCDLPRDRTCILAASQPDGSLERILLHPRDYGFAASEVAYVDRETWTEQARSALKGEANELANATIWSSGFYLWRSGRSPNLEAGLVAARSALADGGALGQLDRLIAHLGS